MTAPPAASFRGVAFCHVPADEPIRLEKLASAEGTNDRWNRPGQPTVYLATELAIALAELARQLELSPRDEPVRRRLLGLAMEVEGLVDLRRPDIRAAVGAPVRVDAFHDREVARDVAERLRADEQWTGLLVPSMAFLDEPARGNLVLFMERLPDGISALVRAQHEAGVVELRPAAARP